MLKIIRKYLIPHHSNKFKPHLLRTKASIIIIALALVTEALLLSRLYVFKPDAGLLASILPQVLVELTNNNRADDLLPALRVNQILTEAARLKAQDMAQYGYFSHVSPRGVTPWYWFQKVGYNYSAAGENLAVNFSDSSDVVRAWMNSEGHKKNILNQKFSDIGIGIAEGTYKNRTTIFIVQLFGTPSRSTETMRQVAIVGPGLPPQALALTAPTQIPKPINNQEAKGAEMFIETTAPTDQTAMPVLANLDTPTPPILSSTLAARLITGPKTFYAYFLSILLMFIAMALTLKIFVKIKVQHPALIFNGLIVMGVLTTILLVNQNLLINHIQIF